MGKLLICQILLTGVLTSQVSSQFLSDPIATPESYYSVHIGSYLSLADAREQVHELSQLGFSPVFIISDELWHDVYFGRFNVYVDALLYKNELSAREMVNCEIVTLPAEAAELSIVNSGPLTPVFYFEYNHMSQIPARTFSEDSVYLEVERLEATGNYESAQDLCEQELNNYPSSDQMSGYLHTRLGIRHLLAGEYDTALHHFWNVSNGNVASDSLTRNTAMRRVAWILRVQNDRLRSYQAYREIERITDHDVLRVRCGVEAVSLIMELAEWDGIGNVVDCRNAAKRAFQSNPLTNRTQVELACTLQLVFMETYMLTGEYLTARSICDRMLSEFSNLPGGPPERELAALLFMFGNICLDLGDFEAAENCYGRVLNEFSADVEIFDRHHPYAEALNGMALIEEQRGRLDRARELRVELIESYPNSVIAGRVRSAYPSVVAGTLATQSSTEQ
ncbi:MAG: SPOR domain-containing protein [Candidatus Thorarchaeota archaeon]|nr:SPOR domain-containing protein [Candidatus Thorarchaeota archaeon]